MSPTTDRDVLLVVYDLGSVTPTEVVRASELWDFQSVFLLADSPHGRDCVELFELIGSSFFWMNEPDLISSLRELRPAGITTFSEAQLRATAELAARLGLPYRPEECVPRIADKSVQRRALVEAGLPGPAFRRVTDGDADPPGADHVSYPAVLKPALGGGSRDTFPLRHATDLSRAMEHIRPRLAAGDTFTLETFIQGHRVDAPWADYLAMDFLVLDGEAHLLLVTDKFELAPPFRERGAFSPPRVAHTALMDAHAAGTRAIKALGIEQGLVDIEIKFGPDGPQIIELNGRLGAWVDDLAYASAGFRPSHVGMLHALGRGSAALSVMKNPSSAPVHFIYLIHGPESADVLKKPVDVAALKGIAGVHRVSVTKRQGDSVDYRMGTSSSVATVSGSVRSHEDLATSVFAIERAAQSWFV